MGVLKVTCWKSTNLFFGRLRAPLRPKDLRMFRHLFVQSGWIKGTRVGLNGTCRDRIYLITIIDY